ncbi:MAG: hypothetical protein UU88_C0002G0003 [Parcubacteria group bacterium GW2011_GWC1_42_11]|uniref:Uncharacterized protein n=1 Tax=Candidatus Nomurabacteria bacterium GW2011_GWC2_42_20 TaxID=1618756 RepID=A0A0G0ZGK9_9BACT|nr:MAG: hypothetical protein UU88_C0002G0003 [Parcubacteria group bacterium GW2011_GWC1_42_11]KKS47900.1 MAG: hypothetical protein UV12_C0004G0008 [Candidatus Nomurabacteria bacterium GW2011_GWC2_42_20]KKT09667.1 MAG: hypothetical protein UV86_C0003G0003 [Candidatus Nomurabacteria bacterium GW2011_GWB1_43_20]
MLFTSLIRNIIQFKDGGINIGLTAIFLLVIANIATASLCDTNILLIQPPHFFCGTIDFVTLTTITRRLTYCNSRCVIWGFLVYFQSVDMRV